MQLPGRKMFTASDRDQSCLLHRKEQGPFHSAHRPAGDSVCTPRSGLASLRKGGLLCLLTLRKPREIPRWGFSQHK